MKKVYIFAIAAVLTIGISAQAQRRGMEHRGNFFFSFDGVVPVGEFSESIIDHLVTANVPNPGNEKRVMPINPDNIGKSASFGAGFSFKYSFNFPIMEDKAFAGPFVGISTTWNKLDGDVSDELDKISCTKPNYINVPLMVGASGRYYFNDVLGVFGEFGIGTDMLCITRQGWKDNYQKYGADFALAWQVGAGAYFGRHLSLGIHYYKFGNHQTISTPSGNYSVNMGALMFKLGFDW